MKIEFDTEEIRPLVESIVFEILSQIETEDVSRIAFDESEAATMLGVSRTCLRDERLRGRIGASIIGRKIRYSRNDLLRFLETRKWKKSI